MESCDFVDIVMAEKANALARYRRFTNITKLFQLLEVFAAVAFISWSSTRLPLVFKLSGEYVLAFSSYLMNQHVVFLLGNVIGVVCYVLSRYTEAGNDSGGVGIHYDDGKHIHIDHRKTTPKPSPVTVGVAPESSTVEESENRLILNEKVTVSEVTAEMAIKQAAKQIERFQRSQSEKLRKQISMKPGGELRRSVSEKRQRKSISGEEKSRVKVTSVQAVDRLSNEEFRIAVERFIWKQQRFLKQQSIVEEEDS